MTREHLERNKLESKVLAELNGGLWHTTRPDRFKDILKKTGAILPEPRIPDHERWKTSRGSHYYPYARTIGAVSLFDFDNFDPETYSQKCPMSSWHEFVPYRDDWGCAVWIQIARKQVALKIISANDLLARQKSEGAYRHTIMPYIDAAHIGRLPCRAFSRAFLVRRGDSQLRPL